VLPGLARERLLSTYRHTGFWKSMDTSKDQQDLERIYFSRNAPWVSRNHEVASVAAG